ncbi:diguanylate cyclase domain-containing protein [Gilvimarinus agarilyticus]|uniref:diguanylate cyclase domain-containing protein n=1 Tax=Gilvimarinus agarilyticus TaxID=679259 RepID=UPI0005A1053C|nr:diguanylate cyclase [Gilvimarinus agarilyticus]
MKTGELIDLADVMDLMLNAVCVVDRAGSFLFVSAAFEQIFGYKPEEVLGTPMIDLVHPDDQARTLSTVGTLLAGEPSPHFENRWVRKDGRVVHVLWTARWSERHQARIAVAHDITERKQMEDRLSHMAAHDQLTNLPNRVLLQDRLLTALATAKREKTYLSLLFIDMDGFKPVNDSYGHAVGDKLLQDIAQRLSASVRVSDTVGRLGGDEFLVLLNGIPEASLVLRVAEKIRAELNRGYNIDGISLTLAPSIGIAHFPEHGNNEQQLIQNADQAMYRAKKAGGNCSVVFSSADNERGEAL